MKLTTNTYQRLLWITASASLLSIAGCSNLPKTASSNNTAMYGTDDRNRDSITDDSPTAYNALDNPHPAPAGGGGAVSASTTSSSSTASSGTSSSSTASSGTSSSGHSGGK
jgi:hypothetical protein